MYNIVLVCMHGASTDLLARKMMKAAEGEQVPANINAYPDTKLDVYIEDADIVLVGPQLAYRVDGYKKKYETKRIPILAINTMDYGMMDGEKILKNAIRIIDEERGNSHGEVH